MDVVGGLNSAPPTVNCVAFSKACCFCDSLFLIHTMGISISYDFHEKVLRILIEEECVDVAKRTVFIELK